MFHYNNFWFILVLTSAHGICCKFQSYLNGFVDFRRLGKKLLLGEALENTTYSTETHT